MTGSDYPKDRIYRDKPQRGKQRMWFQKKTPIPPRIFMLGNMRIGQVVQHKVTGAKAVIVGFDLDDGRENATVSIGWLSKDEFGTTVAEIEPYVESAAVDAVDPTAPDPGKPTPCEK